MVASLSGWAWAGEQGVGGLVGAPQGNHLDFLKNFLHAITQQDQRVVGIILRFLGYTHIPLGAHFGAPNFVIHSSSQLRGEGGCPLPPPQGRVHTHPTRPPQKHSAPQTTHARACTHTHTHTSRHPTRFHPLPAHELQRHPWVSQPRVRQQRTGLAQWGLRAGKHGSTAQGCGTQ